MTDHEDSITRRLRQAIETAQPDIVAVAGLLGAAKRAPSSATFVRIARRIVTHGRRILDVLEAALVTIEDDPAPT